MLQPVFRSVCAVNDKGAIKRNCSQSVTKLYGLGAWVISQSGLRKGCVGGKGKYWEQNLDLVKKEQDDYKVWRRTERT